MYHAFPIQSKKNGFKVNFILNQFKQFLRKYHTYMIIIIVKERFSKYYDMLIYHWKNFLGLV